MKDYWTFRDTVNAKAYRTARDTLLTSPLNFTWPQLEYFNWALEWFDVYAYENRDAALVAPDLNGTSQEYTFDDLRRLSDRRALKFAQNGVKAGDRVLIHLGNVSEFWDVSLALMKLRAHSIPVYPDATTRELKEMATRAAASYIISASNSEVTEIGIKRLDLDRITLDGVESDEFIPSSGTHYSSPLMSYLSSGTTGTPKLITHNQTTYPVGHLSSLAWQGLIPGDRHMNVSEPGWAKHSWSSFYVPWIAGATIVTPPPGGKVNDIIDRVLKHGVSSLCAPVFVWRSLLPQLHVLRGHVRSAQTAGEFLDNALAAAVCRALDGVVLRPGYGQTEATAIAGTKLGDEPTPGFVGAPLPGYDVSIRDAQGQEAPTGYICIALPAEGFSPIAPDRRGDWKVGEQFLYRTGDVGEIVNGSLRIVGRDDDVFKRNGHRVSPAAIEARLSEHPSVQGVGVCGISAPEGHVPSAYLVLTEDASTRVLQSIDRWAKSHLSALEVPGSYHVIAHLPRTKSGKVRRHLLPSCSSVLTFRP